MCAITFSDYQSFIKTKDKLAELKTEPVIKSSNIELVVLSFFLFNLCVCMDMCVKVRGQLWELIISFYYVGSGDQNQVLRLGGRHLYLLNHLAGT